MRGGERYRTAVSAALLILAAAGLLVLPAAAETAAEQMLRVQRIEDSVLAPCCYTEPVSHHQSEIAVKMRLEIAKWVAESKSDQEILNTYVGRYGSKVLVDPRTIPAPWTPWIPWLATILATVFGFLLLRRWRVKPAPAAGSSPAPEDTDLPDIDDEE